MEINVIYDRLVGELRDYFAKNGFSKAVVALSGGIDSAVVVALAVRALGADNVRVLLLPSGYSSSHSVDDSVEMARRCGIQWDTLAIEPIFREALSALNPVFQGTTPGLAEENLQSRIRMLLTMAVCNKAGALMLNTSNKSEIMVGYGTLYGDTCGAVGVIADLYKTDVYRLARYINTISDLPAIGTKGADSGLIPISIINKAPSAELRPDQFDSDSLPPYDVLDQVLFQMVDCRKSAEEIVHMGFDEATVLKIERLWCCSAFKRRQLPPALCGGFAK